MERDHKIPETELLFKPFDVFNDKETKNKIYRHLVDINDIISEDDIRNIKVAFPGSDTIPVYRVNEKKAMAS